MANEGFLGTVTLGGERAHTGDHPPVFFSYPVLADNGQYAPGLVLMADVNGKAVPWDGAAAISGVCDEPCDTASETLVLAQVHGTVKARLLTKTGGAALTAAEIVLLRKSGIFAV